MRRLIDVNKVIGAMQKCLDESPDKKYSVAYFAFKSIIECLKQEPTVDAVEVVHSSWILNDDGSGTCKHCHRTTKSVWDCDNWMNYCPNCGAKMDGERRSDV